MWYSEMSMRSYQEALAYLEQFADYEKVRSASYTPGTFDLGRIEALLAGLGNPHRRYQIVHVAGSKGKGSVCAIVESVLRAAGFRTGLYTSPHLHTFRERIRVSGALIARAEVLTLANELAPHVEAIPGLTWFEIVTAMGLVYFARQGVEVAVVEVGLGGRLDATNVVSPLVSVITSLSLEHTAWLGNTLAQIAAEKAGIIKPGVPVVSAPQAPEALQVIQRRCAELNSPLTLVGRDWNMEYGAITWEGQNFFVVPPGQSRFRGLPSKRVSFFVNLAGRHQAINATVALAALAPLGPAGLEISPRAMREGLQRVKWPGRMEILSADPLLVCDGAHNGDSARQLVAALREWFPGQDWTLIFGASSDKDFGAMFDALVPFAGRIVLTRARHPRAADPERLAELVRERGNQAQVANDLAEALDIALAPSGAGTATIVAGSLFAAADARFAWAQRSGATLPETDDQESS